METIKLDLIPGKKMPSLHASQYDDGRDYHIDLTENRVPYTLDGTETISLTVRKCDNTLVTMDIANTFADKSYIEFRTTEQMNACAGFNYGEITIEKNGTQISSLNFYLQVEGAPDEGGITSQSEINNLKRQVHDAVVEELEDNGASETGYDNTESGLEATNVQDAIDEVNTKIENIPSVDAYTKQESDSFLADEYDATQTYAVGDYRIHEGGMYVCNTAISTAEAWDASHWTLTDVGSALEAITSIIPTKTSQLQNDSGFAQIDDTQSSASKTYSSNKIDNLLDNKYEQKLTQTLKVGESILTEASVVLGANWSGSIESGFTHTSGSTEPLTFEVATTMDKPYLISFNSTGNINSNLFVKIGSGVNVDVYDGTNNTNVGIVADGGYLSIVPLSGYSGTITNLKLREIKDEGDEVTLNTKSVLTSNKHDGLTGYWNAIIGVDNFGRNENASRNVVIGNNSLYFLKSGARNVAIGTYALAHVTNADRNIAIGADAMINQTEGEDNVAIGTNALTYGGNNKNNVAIGSNALNSASSNTTNVQENVAIGKNAGAYTTANQNVFIGHQAGYRNRTGTGNTIVGASSLGTNGGNNNTLIGSLIYSSSALANSIGLGRGATPTKSNQMMLGSTDITEVVICGNKKINFNLDGTVTWETLT